jgi:hypothetical protein
MIGQNTKSSYGFEGMHSAFAHMPAFQVLGGAIESSMRFRARVGKSCNNFT